MGFDRVAKFYRGIEKMVYRDALQKARVAHLDVAAGEPEILLLGDGDGRFLQALVGRVPGAKIDVVEASAKMIGLAKARVPAAAEVIFHHVEVTEFALSKRYDLVVSHFFLDCFELEEIEQIVAAVGACLVEGGEWLISDFQMPSEGFLRRARARVLLWAMYRFFRTTTGISGETLSDPEPVLRSAGFALRERIESNFGFLRADRWVR